MPFQTFRHHFRPGRSPSSDFFLSLVGWVIVFIAFLGACAALLAVIPLVLFCCHYVLGSFWPIGVLAILALMALRWMGRA